MLLLLPLLVGMSQHRAMTYRQRHKCCLPANAVIKCHDQW
jgi:hypothetical protein